MDWQRHPFKSSTESQTSLHENYEASNHLAHFINLDNMLKFERMRAIFL